MKKKLLLPALLFLAVVSSFAFESRRFSFKIGDQVVAAPEGAQAWDSPSFSGLYVQMSNTSNGVVIEGPSDTENCRWWRVNFGSVTGWVTEPSIKPGPPRN